jgi:hypothetical protein
MCVRPRRARVAAASAVLAVTSAVLSACGAQVELPEPSPTGSAASTPSASISVPSDGISLRLLGFDNGPVDAFSIPRSAAVTDQVDQPNAVTVVMSSPSAAEIAGYYRRALPAAGFTITADDPTMNTLTFTGHGWTGALTGSGDATAIFLRPT